MDGKRFARSKNVVIFGVCGGLSEYSGIGVGIMRFLWVLLAVVSGLVPAFIAYTVLAIIMSPPDGAPQEDRFWHHIQGRNVMIGFSLALIGLGFYIIVDRVFNLNLIRYAFPIGLIAIGALLMAFAFRNKNRAQ